MQTYIIDSSLQMLVRTILFSNCFRSWIFHSYICVCNWNLNLLIRSKSTLINLCGRQLRLTDVDTFLGVNKKHAEDLIWKCFYSCILINFSIFISRYLCLFLTCPSIFWVLHEPSFAICNSHYYKEFDPAVKSINRNSL